MAKYTRRVHFFHVALYTKDGNIFQSVEDGIDEFAQACSRIYAFDATKKRLIRVTTSHTG